jgi:hypothetical protein
MAAGKQAGTFSDRLEAWTRGPEPRTLGGLIDTFEEKGFAVLFILLLAVAALPAPTGGVTHVFEAIAMLVALQLIIGRREIWLPDRVRGREIGGVAQGQFVDALVRRIRWLERRSRPRLGRLLNKRVSTIAYGLIVLALSLTAFLAPPFTGLDTLPALGVLVISLGILLEDAVLVLAGLLIGAVGVALVLVLGGAAVKGLEEVF